MGQGKGFIAAVLQRLTSQQPIPALRVNSERYDDVEAARAIRRVTRSMRTMAAQRDAIAALRWSYLVATTIEEMEREAAAEHRLLEMRIALLQVQPACRTFLADIRHVVLESRGDEALSLLKHAVAWRKVFGPDRTNALQSILDLAAMGATLRSHVAHDGAETLYVATAQDLDAFEWNRRGTALEPSSRYLGSGYSISRRGRSSRRPEEPAPEPVVAAEVDLRGIPAVPRPPLAGKETSGPLPHERVHPHVSVPHRLAIDSPTRLAELAHPGVHVPASAPRPLLRRMAARIDGDPSSPGIARPVSFPGTPPPPASAPPALDPGSLPPVRDQVDDAVRGALADMNRFGMPRPAKTSDAAPESSSASLEKRLGAYGSPPSRHPGPQRRQPPDPRLPHRGI